MSDDSMRIGGFQKLTLLDYPGQMACIVFTAGCNFRCPFCQNAGLLQTAAAEDAEESAGGRTQEDEIFSYLEKRRGILDGVVISGGEPLMQEKLPEFIRRIRQLGLLVKVDTNGSFPDRLAYLLEENLVDYVAMDIKSGREGYPDASGCRRKDIVKQVAASIALLNRAASESRCGNGFSCEFRTTLVKGIHCAEDVEEIARQIGRDIPYYLQSYSDAGDILHPEGLASFSGEELADMLHRARRYCRKAELRI